MMKFLVRLCLVLVLISLVGACAQTQAEPEARLPSNVTQESRVPGEYLIGLIAGTDQAVVPAMFSAYGVEEWRHIRKDTYLVRLRSDPGPEEMARLVRDMAAVRYIEPNRIYKTQ